MAGEWIKMRADLLDDPTVDRLAEVLGIDMLTTVGALFCFWAWADKYAVDGVVDGATSRLIDKVSQKAGFCEALVKVGWLEVLDGGIRIPRFDRHNGNSAKERSLKNQRQARWRDSKVDDKKDALPSTRASTAPSTREEKRREEDKPPTVVKRASRKCPPDFEVTEDMRTWAALECPTVNVSKATAKFCDHTFKTAMTDWNGAWRNWLRKDAEYGPAKPGSQSEPAWRTEQRERTQKAAPGVAVGGATQFFTDLEAKDVTPLILG